MIKFETRIIGDKALRERFIRAGDKLRRYLSVALATLGEELRSTLQATTPRLHGDLANSWKVKLNVGKTISLRVGPPLFYARFLEKGTVNHGVQAVTAIGRIDRIGKLRELQQRGEWRIRPRPFFAPAAERVRSRVYAALEKAVKDAGAES
jgi:hypothetical protein